MDNNIINWLDINHNGKKRSICPVCSHTRKNKNDKCMNLDHDKGLAYCHHCNAISFREDISKSIIQNYKLPDQQWKNKTDLSDKMVKWLESRSISQSTIKKLRWTEEVYYQPAINKNVNNIVFNTFIGDTLTNKKYRDGAKHFTQSSGTKILFYNLNSIIGKTEVWITEGEIDVASFYEIGITNVISVPNGANDNDMYWQNSEKYLKDINKFYIAVDNDDKGNEFAEKISHRLGRYRCVRIKFTGKDANEDLKNKCLLKSIKNQEKYPVHGTFTIDDLIDDVYDLYDNGLPETLKPKSEYFGELKNIFSVMRGHLVIPTGIPSHGKSTFTDWYVLNLINDYNMKASWFSPEHSPMKLYKSKLIEKVIGKNFWNDINGIPRVSKNDIEQYRAWANDKIYLTSVGDNEFPTWDWLFDKFREQIYSYGINIFVIDAFNKVLLPKGVKIDEINKVLTKLTSMAQSNNVIIFLVAHPTKMQKNDKGIYTAPTLYDVSGSADFRNQTHDGYCIYRYFENKDTNQENEIEFINLKTKFEFQGEIGKSIKLKYSKINGRIYAGDKEPIQNMITGLDSDYNDVFFDEQEKEIKEENKETAEFIDYDVLTEKDCPF